MLNFLYVFANLFVMVLSQINNQGNGVWSTIDIDKCETEIEDPIMTFDIEKSNINRTHETFRANITATMDIDSTFKFFIDVCKHVDGGCKHYLTYTDGMELTLNKYGKNNLENAFKLSGIDPPQFPIPKGHHFLDNYIMDYCEMSGTYNAYGTFEASVFIVKDEKNVGCLRGVVEYSDDDMCS